MAKKNNISDFQNALLKNSKMIKNNPNSEEKPNTENVTPVNLPTASVTRFQELAEKYQLTSFEELIAVALEHFLELEDYWFENETVNNLSGEKPE